MASMSLEDFKSGLQNKGYTDSQLEGAYNLVKSGQDVQSVVSLLNKNQATNPVQQQTVQQPKTTTTTTTPTTTTPVQTTTTKTSTMSAANQQAVKDQWNSKTYEQQQELIKSNPQLKTYLQQSGLTEKRQTEGATQFNVQERQPGTQPTKGESQWDYQSTDDARTQEMINNLDWYKTNQPQLFNNYDTYKAMFIDGKGRSPEQIQILNDYFFGQQKLQQYMSYSPDELANGFIDGTIDPGIMQIIGQQDPQKYAQVQQAIEAQKNGIYNQAYFNSLMVQNGYEPGTPYGFEMYKKYLGYKDEDQNGIDDLLEIKQSDAELAVLNEINTLTADIERMNLTKRDTLEQLIQDYPGVSLATLQVMANDMTTDLSKRIQDMSISLTKLQGTAQIFEQQRKDAIQARKDTLNELNTMYGMYYKYTPEGISEMAQFEYAAENKTLDQADQGTYVEKQMALDSVLSPIYEQYGSIIQRSQAQVVNDVIAYAQQNGVSLSEALEKNFMGPLKSKPQYEYLKNQAVYGDTSPTRGTIGYDDNGKPVMGWIDKMNRTINGRDLSDSLGGIDTSKVSGRIEAINAIAAKNGGDLEATVSDIYKAFGNQDIGRECAWLVNRYIEGVTGDSSLGLPATWKDRAPLFDQTARPEAGDIIAFDWTNNPKATDHMKRYGHVGMIESVDSSGVWIVDSNWDRNKPNTVTRHHVDFNSDTWQKYYGGVLKIEGKATPGQGATEGGYSDNPLAKANFDEYKKLLGSKGLDTTAKQKEMANLASQLGMSEAQFKVQAEAYWANQAKEDANETIKMIDDLLSVELPDVSDRRAYGTEKQPGQFRDPETGQYTNFGWSQYWFESDKSKAKYDRWASTFDYFLSNMMYEKYKDVKSSGNVTFGAMSNTEWAAIASASTKLKYNLTPEDYRSTLLDLKSNLQAVANKGQISTPQSKPGDLLGGLMTQFNLNTY